MKSVQIEEEEQDDQFGNESNYKASEIQISQISEIDIQNDKYPYCIVWTALPIITWIIPFIGHTGICMDDGTIHDFAGPYTISVDEFSFGKPLKYVPLKIDVTQKDKWNQSVIRADKVFEKTMHNLFTNNCHSHVAQALYNIKYQGRDDWNMIYVWLMCMTHSKYVSFGAFLKTYIPFIIIVIILSVFL